MGRSIVDDSSIADVQSRNVLRQIGVAPPVGAALCHFLTWPLPTNKWTHKRTNGSNNTQTLKWTNAQIWQKARTRFLDSRTSRRKSFYSFLLISVKSFKLRFDPELSICGGVGSCPCKQLGRAQHVSILLKPFKGLYLRLLFPPFARIKPRTFLSQLNMYNTCL